MRIINTRILTLGVMFLFMNLKENSEDKTKTTVDDIDKAIRRIADNIKKDEEGRQTGKHQRL